MSRFAIFLVTVLSIFISINLERPSTNSLRNSLTSLFSFAISCTLLSALCELPIITIANIVQNTIKRQFFTASSLMRNLPFKMSYTLLTLQLLVFGCLSLVIARHEAISSYRLAVNCLLNPSAVLISAEFASSLQLIAKTHYILSATRSFALRALLFLYISSFPGMISCPTFLNGTSMFP